MLAYRNLVFYLKPGGIDLDPVGKSQLGILLVTEHAFGGNYMPLFDIG